MCLALLALLASCDSSTPPPPAGFANAMISDPKTFNPILVTDSASGEIAAHVFDGLVRMNTRTLEIEPWLAERWETSPDGKEWTFHLREGVRWHDGKPLTARDVEFTYRAIFDPKVANSAKHILTIDGQPLRVEVVDDKTVKFRLPRPFAPLLASLQEGIVPEHVLGPSLADGTFAQQWGISAPLNQIVGTGPYRIAEYVQAQFVRLERNPEFWLKDEKGEALPAIGQRTTIVVSDMDAAYLKFVGGQTTTHSPRPEEIANLSAQSSQLGIRVEEVGLSTAAQFVVFNRNPKYYRKDGRDDPKLTWFTDTVFLRALAHAVDKKSMVNNCLSGYGQAAVSEVSPSDTVFHNPNLKDYGYDLEQAKTLLASAGYELRDGKLHDRAGNRVEFSLTTNAGNKIREQMCTMLQDDWGKLGIQVNFRPVDFSTLVAKLDTTFDWDAVLIGFTNSPEPHNGANLLRSSGNLHMWNPSQKSPASEWEGEIDRLLDEGSRELDRDRRKAHYWRIQEILHEQLPMIQTVRQIEHTAYRTTLRNYERTVWGTNRPERMALTP